ncbi:MAG: hypothetical protein JO277_03060 [Candidatus Eremiobacteraeota bacterium]|nr:hypothetical protein [Candidatus Eremiobacteraeota bacterium]
MAGIGPGPENLTGAFLNEQVDASQTASDLSSPFSNYLTQAAAARNAAAANAETQLDSAVASVNAMEPAGDYLQALDALSLQATNDLLLPSDRVSLQSAANYDAAMAGIASPDLSTTASALASETAISSAQSAYDLADAKAGFQVDTLRETIASDDQIASSLTSVADTMAEQDQVSDIQRFKLDTTSENADFVALAKLDNEAGITLGMLDTNA